MSASIQFIAIFTDSLYWYYMPKFSQTKLISDMNVHNKGNVIESCMSVNRKWIELYVD